MQAHSTRAVAIGSAQTHVRMQSVRSHRFSFAWPWNAVFGAVCCVLCSQLVQERAGQVQPYRDPLADRQHTRADLHPGRVSHTPVMCMCRTHVTLLHASLWTCHVHVSHRRYTRTVNSARTGAEEAADIGEDAMQSSAFIWPAVLPVHVLTEV